jgi:hypothetical protein
MAFVLKPHSHQADGSVLSYTVALPNNAIALIDRVVDKGWELTIRTVNAKLEERGLFGTPHDILCLLEVEYPYSLQESRTPLGVTISQLRPPAPH